MFSGRGQRARDAWIPRIDDAGRRGWKNYRLLTWHQRDVVIVLFMLRLDAVPAKTVIQRQVRRHPPTVLPVQAQVLVPPVERPQIVLSALARNAQQKIREIKTGLAPVKVEATIQVGERIRVDLSVL